MQRDEALAELGLGPSADPRAVRRRFRELARTRHPDRGGDPEAFATLHRAYAALRDAPAPARPTVARGRPSRDAAPPAVAPDEVTATAARLAAALTADADRGPGRLRLVSVAPGARRNRLVQALPEASLSVLELRAEPAVTVRLVVRVRSARRAVAALPLDAEELGPPWTRRRGDAALELRCEPRQVDATAGARAATAAGAAARLLAALDWPLASWRPEPAA